MSAINLPNFYIRSSLFFILSAVGAALNYFLYIVLARVLPVRDFGDFAVVIAISNQVLGVLLALNLTSIYLVKNNQEKEARQKAQTVQKLLIWIFLGLTIVIGLFSPFLANWLKIQDPVIFIVLAVMLLVSIPSVIWTGYLQGHKKLINVGIYNLSSSGFKFFFAVALGLVGGATGSVLGVLLGVLVGLLVVRIFTRTQLPSVASSIAKISLSDKATIRELRRYIIGSAFVVGFLSILQTIDITYAKILFSPEIAGAYSGISVISYAFYYLALLLIWIILPEISPTNHAQNKRLLKTSYKVFSGLAALVLILSMVLKDKIVNVVLGDRYISQSELLTYTILYQITLVSIALYAYYLLVLRNSRAFLLAGCILVPSVILPWQIGSTPRNMIIGLWGAILLGFFVYSVVNILLKSRSGHAEKTVN